MRLLIRFLILALPAACGGAPAETSDTDMNALADRYVRLVLAVGQHDPDYVDAYYGPPEWRREVEKGGPRDLEALGAEAARLRDAAVSTPQPVDQLEALRREYLIRQLGAVAARIRMLAGERLTFDEESEALYNAVAPVHPPEHFEAILSRLEGLVPGEGPLPARVEEFRQRFVIPPDRLDAVFRAAIEACRSRTARHVALPEGERFTVEYVTGKSWSGYNWYQGEYRSLIQVNTDLPIYIDRAIDLACHEGYPGHHVYNVLLEQHLVQERGWREFTVYPLFSPQSLIAEGTANFGIEVAFPGDARVAYERETLFPLAGLDPASAEAYYRVQAVLDELSYAGNEAARRYLNGEIDSTQAADWLERYALMAPERAAQRVRFIEQYRSYVINYNLGKDLVGTYVEAHGGSADRPEDRWRVFGELLESPRLPGGLRD